MRRGSSGGRSSPGDGAGGVEHAAGKRTLTQQLTARPMRKAGPEPVDTVLAAAADVEAVFVDDPAGVEDDGGAATASRPGAEAAQDPMAVVADAEGSASQPLPDDLRAELELKLVADLSGIRLHIGPAASRAARAIGAKAYTVGKDIYFGEAEYAPASKEGRELIAHEVAHTVQQPQQPAAKSDRPEVSQPNEPEEREADAFAAAFVAEPAPAVAHVDDSDSAVGSPVTTRATPGKLLRYPDVVPAVLERDKTRYIDPRDWNRGMVWEPARGYLRNPTATLLSSVVSGNKVTGAFANGEFMYVVDASGQIWVGKRQGVNMPHPTLLGGPNPTVTAAGMVKIEGGKIVRIDNHSGHYQPPRSALTNSLKSFTALPKEIFRNLAVESIHVDAAGNETRRQFDSLRLLKLKSWDVRPALRRVGMRLRHDPKFRGKVKDIGGGAAVIIATAVVTWLLGKLIAEIEAKQIADDIARQQGKIEEALARSIEAHTDELDALNESNPDASVFVNLKFRIGHLGEWTPPSEGGGTDWSFIGTELVSADVSTTAIATGVTYEKIKPADDCTPNKLRTDILTTSEPAKVSDIYGKDE